MQIVDPPSAISTGNIATDNSTVPIIFPALDVLIHTDRRIALRAAGLYTLHAVANIRPLIINIQKKKRMKREEFEIG